LIVIFVLSINQSPTSTRMNPKLFKAKGLSFNTVSTPCIYLQREYQHFHLIGHVAKQLGTYATAKCRNKA
jgi:hypothetical protein